MSSRGQIDHGDGQYSSVYIFNKQLAKRQLFELSYLFYRLNFNKMGCCQSKREAKHHRKYVYDTKANPVQPNPQKLIQQPIVQPQPYPRNSSHSMQSQQWTQPTHQPHYQQPPPHPYGMPQNQPINHPFQNLNYALNYSQNHYQGYPQSPQQFQWNNPPNSYHRVEGNPPDALAKALLNMIGQSKKKSKKQEERNDFFQNLPQPTEPSKNMIETGDPILLDDEAPKIKRTDSFERFEPPKFIESKVDVSFTRK